MNQERTHCDLSECRLNAPSSISLASTGSLVPLCEHCDVSMCQVVSRPHQHEALEDGVPIPQHVSMGQVVSRPINYSRPLRSTAEVPNVSMGQVVSRPHQRITVSLLTGVLRKFQWPSSVSPSSTVNHGLILHSS